MKKVTITLALAVVAAAALANNSNKVIVMEPVTITADVQHVNFDKPLVVLGVTDER